MKIGIVLKTAVGCLLWAFVLLAGPAHASTFDVKGAEVTKGEHELVFGTAGQNGFPVNSDFVRGGYEVGYSYGFYDWFKAGIKVGGNKPVGGSFDFTTAGVESQFAILRDENASVLLSWYTGVDVGLLTSESEALTFGPLIGFELSCFDITLNPLFQKVWNPDEPGIDFAYAWQVKTGIAEKVGLGVEGYGTIPDIGNTPSVEFQDHRIGPVVCIENHLKTGVKSELQLGILFGMTDATANTTGRAKFAILW